MIGILFLFVLSVVATDNVEGTTPGTFTTGARCITSCTGLPDGDYQSCNACNCYASCWGGGIITDNRPCAPATPGLVWDDNLKRCEYTSPTCMGPVSCTTLSTTNDYHYIDIEDIDGNIPFTFTFKVKACQDAHVGFYATSPNNAPDGSPMYEIVISGWWNTYSVIRKEKQQRPPLDADAGLHRLSCSESRDFWITFDNGHIKVGEGFVVGADMFMEYDDPSPLTGIVKLGVSTYFDATGEWCYRLQ